MTTIAWDGKTLAGDKQMTVGSTPISCTKIERIKFYGKDALIGSSGKVEDCDCVINWIKTGKDQPEITASNEVSVMVVTKDAVYYLSDSLHFHNLGKTQWAIGSGCDYALGAMKFGATAEQAVEIASQLDNETGLGVDTLTFGKK